MVKDINLCPPFYFEYIIVNVRKISQRKRLRLTLTPSDRTPRQASRPQRPLTRPTKRETACRLTLTTRCLVLRKKSQQIRSRNLQARTRTISHQIQTIQSWRFRTQVRSTLQIKPTDNHRLSRSTWITLKKSQRTRPPSTRTRTNTNYCQNTQKWSSKSKSNQLRTT